MQKTERRKGNDPMRRGIVVVCIVVVCYLLPVTCYCGQTPSAVALKGGLASFGFG